MKTITAYKLFKVRKNGTLGPLFINARLVVPIGKWLKAESHPTKRFAFRPGWHCAPETFAPHLGTKGRVWCEVQIRNFEAIKRPKAQGNFWYLAKQLKVVRIMEGV